MARPEKEIPANAPLEVRELAQELRALRRSAQLTYQSLSVRSHYSTATLSAAASGNSVPKWEVVANFVQACGAHTGISGAQLKDQLKTFRRLYENAHARVVAEQVVLEKVVAAEPAPAQPDADEQEEDDKSQTTGRRGRKTETPKTVRSQSDDTIITPELPDGLLTLVRQFVDVHTQLEAKFPDDAQRVSSLTVDHIHTALALCTTPGDVLALMREMVADKGLTMGDLERRSKPIYPISGATYAHVLNGTELPTTEWLHIFLRACGVDQERTLIWHYTVTRIKIATLRHRTPDTPLPFLAPPRPLAQPPAKETPLNRFMDRLDSPFTIHLSLSTVMNVVTALAMTVLAIWQIVRFF
ncbi:helix-turn-helix domain-containing protein [Streptomyces massasporeus]